MSRKIANNLEASFGSGRFKSGFEDDSSRASTDPHGLAKDLNILKASDSTDPVERVEFVIRQALTNEEMAKVYSGIQHFSEDVIMRGIGVLSTKNSLNTRLLAKFIYLTLACAINANKLDVSDFRIQITVGRSVPVLIQCLDLSGKRPVGRPRKNKEHQETKPKKQNKDNTDNSDNISF